MISLEKLDCFISTKQPVFFVVQTVGEEGVWKFITSSEELRTLHLTQVVCVESVTRISDTPEKSIKESSPSRFSFLWKWITNLLKKIGRSSKGTRMSSSSQVFPSHIEVENPEDTLPEEKRRAMISLINGI